MWDAYLLPEDVSPIDAARVLDFLNTADGPDDLAEAVEFPNERDIGLRLAARILARRDELGGFDDLEQVYDLPLIGPERFTELVVALSGARPPRRGATVPQEVADEIRNIRSTVDALQSALLPTATVRVWSVQESVWLGQGVTLLAHATDNQGKPLVDYPVTMTANWGELVGTSGFKTIRGASLQTSTDSIGMVKAKLFPVLGAPVGKRQEQVLEAQLARLPMGASSPAQAQPALAAFAESYRQDGSAVLRDAVDAYYAEYGHEFVDTERRGGALAAWPTLPATVQCYVHDAEIPERGNVTLGLGVHTVTVRNWLAAFLAAFQGQLGDDQRLRKALLELDRDDQFVTQALDRVHAFVGLEKGVVGSALRDAHAERILDRYVQDEIQTFPEDIRRDVLTSVQSAATTLATGGLAVFDAVETTKITSPFNTRDATIDNVGTRVGLLETETVRSDELTSFATEVAAERETGETMLREETTRNLAAKADKTTLVDFLSELGTELSTISTQLGGIDESVQNLRRRR